VDHIQMPTATVTLTGQVVNYILTMVDQASQWVELAPVPDCSVRTTALAIQSYWISRFGMPKSLYSDAGPAFTSNLFQEICKIYGVTHTCASSQNHKAVSRAETTHRLILSGLRKICAEQTNWPDYIPGLLLSLRSSVVTTIGLTPSYMVHHREMRIPLTATLPISVDSRDKTLTQIVETTRLTDNIIRENTEESFNKTDVFYNRKAKVREFVKG